tara:strand:+ start:48 stop:533 length:486 start_codon:yes stop_codon:yes gene_type:complete
MAENFKKYNFKSVGLSVGQKQQLKNTQGVEIPVGIKTPLQFGYDYEGLFAMNKDLANQVADNFRNLLLTNKGERVCMYNYGANLRELTFELGTENADVEAMSRITQACSDFMPYVNLIDFVPKTLYDDNEHVAKISILVTYDLPLLNSFNRAIEIVLFIAG